MLGRNVALDKTYARLFLVLVYLYLVVYGVVQWLQAAISIFGVSQRLASVANQTSLHRQAASEQRGSAAGLSLTAMQLGAIGVACIWTWNDEGIMTLAQILLLIPAGVLAGLVGTIAGVASLVSYPALLLMGVAPVTSNMSNTIALVADGAASIASSRPELRGQGHVLARILPCSILGGLVGGTLLLVSPAGSFERIVPFLIAGAALLILFPKAQVNFRSWLSRIAAGGHTPGTVNTARISPGIRAVYALAYFLVGVYGGYFGAAAGVAMLALLSSLSDRSFVIDNALKNTTMACANLVAAALFLLRTSPQWDVIIPLAIGMTVGGYLGPVIFRHLNTMLLRRIIGVLAIGLAVSLFVDAYR